MVSVANEETISQNCQLPHSVKPLGANLRRTYAPGYRTLSEFEDSSGTVNC